MADTKADMKVVWTENLMGYKLEESSAGQWDIALALLKVDTTVVKMALMLGEK